jgi:hypothetical protein
VRCSRKQVARLMREAGLRGCMRGRGKRTTHRDERAVPAPDLVGRNFVAAAPDKVWTAADNHVCTHRRRLPVSDLRPRCLLSEGGRLVDGLPSACGARDRRPGDGPLETQTCGGVGSPFLRTPLLFLLSIASLLTYAWLGSYSTDTCGAPPITQWMCCRTECRPLPYVRCQTRRRHLDVLALAHLRSSGRVPRRRVLQSSADRNPQKFTDGRGSEFQ